MYLEELERHANKTCFFCQEVIAKATVFHPVRSKGSHNVLPLELSTNTVLPIPSSCCHPKKKGWERLISFGNLGSERYYLLHAVCGEGCRSLVDFHRNGVIRNSRPPLFQKRPGVCFPLLDLLGIRKQKA